MQIKYKPILMTIYQLFPWYHKQIKQIKYDSSLFCKISPINLHKVYHI